MADMEEVINQAISDFDDIEKAIEEQGVNVPSGTDTKEYGNLIRNIPRGGGAVDQTYNPESGNAQSGLAVAEALEGLPIKYVEGSTSGDNISYLRDLESGTYVLYGSFRPHVGSGTVCRFTSNLLVNVVKGTLNKVPTSHIQIFYPVHNVVQFCDITDTSYKRTDIKLNELANAATVEEMIAAANKASQNLYGNALIGKASGEVIRVDDVSPIEHTVKAVVRCKNIIPYPFKDTTKTLNGLTFTDNGDGSVTVDGTAAAGTAFSINTRFTVASAGRYTLSGCPAGGSGGSYMLAVNYYVGEVETTGVRDIGNGYSITLQENTDVKIYIYIANGQTVSNLTFYPQFELGDTATEYEPYVDPSTVTVTRCGKNLLDITKAELIVVGAGGAERYGVVFDNTGTYTFSCNAPSGIAVKVVTDGEYGDYVTLINNVIYTFTLAENQYLIIYQGSEGVLFNCELENAQIEQGDTATDFEAYNAATYTPEADGTVNGITSVSPTMTLLTDKAGVTIEAEYNQDSNSVIEGLRADVTALDNSVAELIGNIPSAEIVNGVLYLK